MARVVVTGASGTLGAVLLPQLAAQGLGPVPAGRADGVDLTLPGGGPRLGALLDGADAVVHAASDPRHTRAVDVEGTARLVEAARRHRVPHLVYVSIVGVERTPLGYHRAKHTAEQTVVASGVPHTIVRGTQWFELVQRIAEVCGHYRAAPRDVVLAPSDVGEFATLITRRILAGAADATVEFGGPEQVALTVAAKQVTGRRVLHVGVPGRVAHAVRGGSLLPGPGAQVGTRSWSEWVGQHRVAR